MKRCFGSDHPKGVLSLVVAVRPIADAGENRGVLERVGSTNDKTLVTLRFEYAGAVDHDTARGKMRKKLLESGL